MNIFQVTERMKNLNLTHLTILLSPELIHRQETNKKKEEKKNNNNTKENAALNNLEAILIRPKYPKQKNSLPKKDQYFTSQIFGN